MRTHFIFFSLCCVALRARLEDGHNKEKEKKRPQEESYSPERLPVVDMLLIILL